MHCAGVEEPEGCPFVPRIAMPNLWLYMPSCFLEMLQGISYIRLEECVLQANLFIEEYQKWHWRAVGHWDWQDRCLRLQEWQGDVR